MISDRNRFVDKRIYGWKYYKKETSQVCQNNLKLMWRNIETFNPALFVTGKFSLADHMFRELSLNSNLLFKLKPYFKFHQIIYVFGNTFPN